MKLLAVTLGSHRYNFKQEEGLKHRLSLLDEHARLRQASSVNELLLDEYGRTVDGGYRLTTWSLYQLCQYVGSGLYRLVQDLAAKTVDDKSERFALKLLNDVVKFRFAERLYGKKILFDERTKQIEGIVGPGYKWLSNLVLYERVREALRSHAEEQHFLEAVLNGRWMLLRFYQHKRYFDVPVGVGSDCFYTGYHFSNNETGLASIRAAAILVRRLDQIVALSPMSAANRVRHVGRAFDYKLNKLIGGLVLRTHSALEYRDAVTNLRSTGLSITGTLEEKKGRLENLAQQLSRLKLNDSLSRRMVESAIMQGSYETEPQIDLATIAPQTWDSRNQYDLFVAIAREAKHLDIRRREKAEQAAYSLLTGRLTIE